MTYLRVRDLAIPAWAGDNYDMTITGHIQNGVVVLDGGTTFPEGTRVVGDDAKSRYVGDVDDAVREVAGWLAPMPGGVGPMTRAMLLTNVVEAAEGAAAARDF